MATGARYRVKFRRRRDQKTDFRRRLELIKSGTPRLVVRTSSNNCVVQVVKFEPKGDKTLVASDAVQLRKAGWKAHTGNVPASYLAGYLCGLKAKKAGVKSAVLDIGIQSKGRRIFAALKGFNDAGVKVPYGGDELKEDIITGKHIAAWAEKAPKPMFNNYKKGNLEPSRLPQHFAEVKQQLTNTFSGSSKGEVSGGKVPGKSVGATQHPIGDKSG